MTSLHQELAWLKFCGVLCNYRLICWGKTSTNFTGLECLGYFAKSLPSLVYVPRTQLTSIFEGQPSKTRPFPIKTRVIRVLALGIPFWKNAPLPRHPCTPPAFPGKKGEPFVHVLDSAKQLQPQKVVPGFQQAKIAITNHEDIGKASTKLSASPTTDDTRIASPPPRRKKLAVSCSVWHSASKIASKSLVSI